MNPDPVRPRVAPQVALPLAAAALLLIVATAAGAQTLTDPTSHPNAPRPDGGKPAAAKHMKACPEFGAGFYRVEGTNTCVKVGGFIEGGMSSSH
jgi:hypothetical protein